MEEIIDKISAKRNQVLAFISKQGPKNKWLMNIAIIGGIVGTTLAGIPAIGGTAAIDGIKSVTQPQLPIWQLLCIGAAVSTMAATIATSLRNNFDTANKLSKAQICAAKLEMLDLLVQTKQIELKQAIEKYGEYAAEVAFLTHEE
jgi:hypothetical protein